METGSTHLRGTLRGVSNIPPPPVSHVRSIRQQLIDRVNGDCEEDYSGEEYDDGLTDEERAQACRDLYRRDAPALTVLALRCFLWQQQQSAP